MEEYLVKVKGESKGPYTAEQMMTQIRRKRLSRQHQISNDGGMTWGRAGDDERLFSASSVVDLASVSVSSEPASVEVIPVKESGSSEWMYSVLGQQLGPVSESEVRMLIASDGIQHNTLVWQQGMVDWVEVQHVPAFAMAVRSKKSSEPRGGQQISDGIGFPSSAERTLHWPSVVAMLTAIAAWTTLLPSALFCLGLAGAMEDGFPTARGVKGLALLLFVVPALSPSVLFCFTSINLGHKAVGYINNEPGRYDGTTYSIFGLILGYLTALILLGVSVFCLVSASR